MKQQKIAQKIIKFIQLQTAGKPALVGLSGGLDSSVVAVLAVKALGARNVFGVLSPSASNTPRELTLAKSLAKKLNIRYSTFLIEPIILAYKQQTKLFKNKKSLGNLKSRVRMSILYGKANERDALVIGTGNKSEIMTGYFTKYGDGGADILPIGDLYKTDVRELAVHLGVPKEIIDRPPTAGLWVGQTDEKEMGISYDKLDQILTAIETNQDLHKFNGKDVAKIKKMIAASVHKRKLPPICQIYT